MSISDLREALEYIKRNPQEYDPTLWFSGTTADLGGHLVMRAGWTPNEDADPGFAPVVHHPNAEKGRYVHFVACEIAGISPWEGHCLWSATNTVTDLERMVGHLERDEAIFELLSLPTDAYQHAWTNSQDRILVAAHRRTSYVRLGSLIQIEHWDSRRDALDHALSCARGRILTRHDNPEQM